MVADAYPNFSICGIPDYVSGEVGHWRNLAHRTHADLEATGMRLRLDPFATDIDVAGRRLSLRDPDGSRSSLHYDELVVATGALPVRPPIAGLDDLGAADGVHLLHSMSDTFALIDSLDRIQPNTALIVGAGYVGLGMAEGLTARGIAVTQVEMLPEVLPTVNAEPGALVHVELDRHNVQGHTRTAVTRIGRARQNGDNNGAGRLPHVWAAGDCAVIPNRLLHTTYLSLGTTAHKQGRVAGDNALGGSARYAGSLGTQVVKVFDLVAARTGLREREAVTAGYRPGTAKRVDTNAAALFHQMSMDGMAELDLSYTPPLGSPWDAVQMAAQVWVREHQLPAKQTALHSLTLADVAPAPLDDEEIR